MDRPFLVFHSDNYQTTYATVAAAEKAISSRTGKGRIYKNGHFYSVESREANLVKVVGGYQFEWEDR